MDVNTNGVLFTAQAAGQQMRRFKLPGSIILIASMSGSITNKARDFKYMKSQNNIRIYPHRITRGLATTLANRPYFRWLVAWLAS